MLPQYHFEALLGRGGMGAVYKAVQVSLERAVAIKILPGDLLDDSDSNFTERFKNEARLMAKMNHPGIVNVFDFGETQTGLLYFVMEFIDGTDVSKMIAASGRLPAEHALAITAHVCDALEYAHTHGVIHRDIKPANVLINMEGQVKVADFGLAKVSDPNIGGLTKTNMAMGTPDFTAPEAYIYGMQLDGRADIYSLGVMLYQMLTGNIPRGMWRMPSMLGQTDPRFDAIIARAMQVQPESRHQSAIELRRELDVILTVPYVKHDDRSASAAIPKQELALIHQERAMVPQRGPQKNAPLAQRPRQPQRVVTYVEKKSNLPAILIGVLLAVGGFLAWQKFGTPAPAPVLQQPSIPAPLANTVTTLPTTGWQPINTPLSDRITSLADGWKNFNNSYKSVMQARDLAVRVKMRLKSEYSYPLLFRESSVTGLLHYAVRVSRTAGDMELIRRVQSSTGITQDNKTIGTAKLPRDLSDKDEFELAFTTQGEQITVFFDGKPLIQTKDVFCPGDGFSVGSSGELDVKDLEWMPLEPAPGSMRVVEMPQGSRPAGWLNALALVEPETHAGRSIWENTDDGLKWVTNDRLPTYAGTIQLPVPVGGHYAVAMEFTPAETTGSVAIILPLGGDLTTACWFTKQGLTGVAKMDGKDPQELSAPYTSPFKLEAGRRYRAQASVQPVTEGVDIQFHVDDKLVGSYRGPVSRLSCSTMWQQPQDRSFVMLGANMPVTFHRANVWSLPDVAPAALAEAAATALPAQTLGGHRYQIVEAKGISLKDAKARAASMGGHLVTITSSAENDFIMMMCQPVLTTIGRQLWIGGLRTSYGTSGWTWTTGEPFSFPGPPTTWQSSTLVGDALTILGGSNLVWNDYENPETTSRVAADIYGFMVEWDEGTAPDKGVPPPDSLAFAGHRYLFVPDKNLTWTQANAASQGKGGHLATITSKEENDFIANNVIAKLNGGLGAWIGGTSEGTPGQWRWVTGEPFAFTVWGTNEPSNSTAEIAIMFTNGGLRGAEPPLWRDLRDKGTGVGDLRAGYLVEWDQDKTTAPGAASPVETINLLASVDVTRDVVKGTWERKPEGLVTTRQTNSQVLEFNQVVPEEYDFEIEFTPGGGTREVVQILPLPGRFIIWKMCPSNSDPAAYVFGPFLDSRMVSTSSLNEAKTTLPRLKVGQRYRSLVEVRKGSLRAVLDGHEIVKYTGDLARITTGNETSVWVLRNPQHAGVAAFTTDVTFHKAELRTRGFVSERLAQIEAQFNAAWERDVTQSAAGKAVADLDKKYLAAIDRALADATKAGKLDDFTGLKDEKNRVAKHTPLPDTDPVNIAPSLGKLRVTYRKSIAPLLKQRDAAADPVYARYDQALAALETELTKQNAISDAQSVRAKRGEIDLLRNPGKAALVATSTPAAASATTPAASSLTLTEAVLKEKPPAPFTPDEAIRWALSLSGSATVLKGKEESQVFGTASIPKGKYTLVRIKIGEKQLQHVVSLAGLANLAELRELVLDHNLITDAGLAFLPPLPKLAKLGLHDCGLTDASFTHLTRQPALAELDVGYNKISGTGLASFTGAALLKSLAIGSPSLTDEGIARITRCTALTTLDLSSSGTSKVTNLAPLAGISSLRDLRLLHNTTDALVQSLSSATQITAIDLSLSPISDFALDQISSMKTLRELNFYGCSNLTDSGYLKLLPLGKNITRLISTRTRLSDSAFAELCDKFTELAEIDISYTGVSPAGLSGLTKLKKLSSLTVHAQQCSDDGLRVLNRITSNLNFKSFGLREFEKLDKKRQEAVRRSLTRYTF